MKIEDIAALAHEANRLYCISIGDDSQVRWDEAPQWQRDSSIQGVTAIFAGAVTSQEATHESWMEEKRINGWRWGAAKNAETKQHPCFVPYRELPAEQKVKDAIYFFLVSALIGE